MSETKQTKPGRKPRPMPAPIPETPRNLARIILNTPPKKEGEWRYLKKGK